MAIKLRFTQPESRAAFTVADVEAPLRIDQVTKRVSGFYRKAATDGAWLESVPFDFAFSELVFAGTKGSPLERIEQAIVARLTATGKLPAGTVEQA